LTAAQHEKGTKSNTFLKLNDDSSPDPSFNHAIKLPPRNNTFYQSLKRNFKFQLIARADNGGRRLIGIKSMVANHGTSGLSIWSWYWTMIWVVEYLHEEH